MIGAIRTVADDDIAKMGPTIVGRPTAFSSYPPTTVSFFRFIDSNVRTNGDNYGKASNSFQILLAAWATTRSYTPTASSPHLQLGVLDSSSWTTRTSLPLAPALIGICQWPLTPVSHPWTPINGWPVCTSLGPCRPCYHLGVTVILGGSNRDSTMGIRRF
ncbi:hypothetical protein M9H77_06671 [Catharanthus roseus]|uniref:Uncharacterized protein n=1 Tax=Catharanthus roseus TaxID=4058 RepID=A0ACC0BSR6_CATRO|nr:hypothetical protein M9H77_06671 [Catharanthus roseus]